MARYLCNAPGVGTYIEGYGTIPQGAEFEIDDKVNPHTMWIPLDKAAHAAFKRTADATIARLTKEAVEAGQPLTQKELKALAMKLEPRPDATPQRTDSSGEQPKVLMPVFKSGGSRQVRTMDETKRASDSE